MSKNNSGVIYNLTLANGKPYPEVVIDLDSIEDFRDREHLAKGDR